MWATDRAPACTAGTGASAVGRSTTKPSGKKLKPKAQARVRKGMADYTCGFYGFRQRCARD
ncbi:hypothetical protein ACNKHK_06065 [Shigella flexneri]